MIHNSKLETSEQAKATHKMSTSINKSNHGKALVVDDDEDNRQYTADILNKNGFTAVAVNDGKEGVNYYRKNRDYAIVVSDWSMPNMMGTEMVRIIRKLNPNQKVLMMSSDPDSVRHILSNLGILDVEVIYKDYDYRKIITAVLKTINGDT